MNFYAVFALLMVFVVAWFQLDIGAMKKHELQASHGHGFDEGGDDSQAKDLNDELEIEESENGRVFDLIMPIVVLIFSTFFFMLFTGYQVLAADGIAFNILGAFENTDVGMSLVYGGIVGLLAAMCQCCANAYRWQMLQTRCGLARSRCLVPSLFYCLHGVSVV